MHEADSASYAPPSLETIAARHETSDTPLDGVVGFAIAFVVVLVGVLVLSLFFLRHEFKEQDESQAPPSPFLGDARPLPPEPRLQPSRGHESMDWEDLQKLHAQEDAALNSYAWIGKDKHAARIPIDHAMDLLIERGLPMQEQKGQRP